MATKPGLLSEWPWQPLGQFKLPTTGYSCLLSQPGSLVRCLSGVQYLLFAPFAAKAIQANFYGGHDKDNWCMHMLIASALRYLHGQIWMSASRFHYLVEKYQIQTKGIKFEQVDRESSWDDYIILHVLVATFVHSFLPGFQNFPLYNGWGLVILLLLHAGPAEFIYYWGHRLLHHHYLYTRYHSHHHASFVTEPVTGSVHPFAEHVMYTAMFAVPFLGTWALGGASLSMFYAYWLGFDLLNCIGHCNWEFIPTWVFKAFPPLKYLVYTPSYHSLHHTQVHTNFALFMPLYDYLGGTVDGMSDLLHSSIRKGRTDRPDFIFLAHGTELLSAFHVPFGLPQFAAHPYAPSWLMYLLWPLTLPLLALVWLFGQTFVADKYKLRDLRMQTWVIPRFGFQYFLPFEKKHINNHIEKAILDADRIGAKVFTLGALNKNEGLNGGGTLFVERHKHLRVRVVHGNTLTAAVILDKIPKDVEEVFLTGATSKLGRAISLYLCRRGVRVLMLTSALDRFCAIQQAAPAECRHLLVQATSYADGKDCKTWILGKWLTSKDQACASAGSHFHQFVVPPVVETRADCTYGKLAAMRLPPEVQGLRTCEMTMERGAVHACHAGGLVHALEGWPHHEVGAIDPDRIDITWEAALKHGFRPV
eukprot:SM000176S03123  [mRNA]  locus=s176:54048:58847:- [translate_table: standard]